MIYFLLTIILIYVLLILFGMIHFHLRIRIKESKRIIACVGDSNTYGKFLFLRFLNHYPRILQQLIPGYQVFNFGYNGSTAKIFSMKPYIKTNTFLESKQIEPDVVVLIFGCNDSKGVNWTKKSDFKREYKELISQYRNLERRPEIYLGTPMYPHGKSYGIDYVNFDDINASILEIGKEWGIPVIDFYHKTKPYIEYFSYDKIHLNRKGHRFVAQTICNFLDRY